MADGKKGSSDSEASSRGSDPPASKAGGSEADAGRRRALGMLIGAGSVAYAGAVAVPGYAYLTGDDATPASPTQSWKRVAQLERLPDGKPERVRILGETRDAFTVTRGQTLGSVWLERSGERVRALSAECPHLGCAIDLAGDSKSYGCPCHTSRFGLDGKAESGPSPRGMDELAVRIVDGWVEVEFHRYRQGVSERVEVG